MNGLEALNNIKGLPLVKDFEKANSFTTIGEFVPDTIKSIEKELKALSILKNSFLGIELEKDLIGYYFEIGNSRFYITQEEFELLKEILI